MAAWSSVRRTRPGPCTTPPFDFWRYSTHSWRALFNAATGFELVDVAMGERASIVADVVTAATAGLEAEPAFLGSSVLARKTGPTVLEWDITLDLLVDGDYPA